MNLTAIESRTSAWRVQALLGSPLVSAWFERRELLLRVPLVTGRETIHTRTVFLFFVRDKDGVVGVGEGSPLAWAGTETVDECAEALQHLARVICQAGDVHEWLVDRPAAEAALDLAFYDLVARRRGMPLACLLTEGAVAESVAVNALVTSEEDARVAVRAGFQTLKLKVGRDLDADVRLLRGVRDAVGPSVGIRIDPNGAWPDVASALLALKRLSPVGLEYVEQPIPAGEPVATAQALAQIRSQSGVLIAPDESVTGLDTAEILLSAGAADVLVLKPMRLGGIDRALGVARLAIQSAVGVVVTGFLGSAVERAGALHLAAAVDAELPVTTRRAHGLGAGSWLAEDVAECEAPSGGRLSFGGRAGHGVVLGPPG